MKVKYLLSLFILCGLLWVKGTGTATLSASPSRAGHGTCPLDPSPGMLWKISGNGLTQCSYILGTSHGDSYNYHIAELFSSLKDLQPILDTIQVLANETSKDYSDSLLRKDARTAVQIQLDAHKETAWNAMPAEPLYEELFETKEQYQLVDAYLAQWKPMDYQLRKPAYWVLNLEITTANAQKRAKSVDQCIYEYAHSKGKKCVSLETPQEQARAIVAPLYDSLEYKKSYQEQAKDLYEKVLSLKADTILNLSEVHEKYLQNDFDNFRAYLSQSVRFSGFPRARKAVADRNQKWLPKIESFIADHSCLIAVGFGHLMGDKNLLELLREQGYVVTPVSKEH